VEAAEALGQAGDPRLNADNCIPLSGGTFLMGAQNKHKSKPGYDPDASDNEGPVREVSVAPFEIGRFPVTVQEFRAFVEEDDETGYRELIGEALPDDWDEQILHLNRPVVNVSWFAAEAYCKWMTAKRDKTYRLPKETEWEFAARRVEGRVEGRRYPWGDEPPDTNRANYNDAGIGAASPVGLFPGGATPEGIDDMAGNVWEWTADWYDAEEKYRVVRGGSWFSVSRYLRAANRYLVEPGDSLYNFGFRVVREA
jgi:formylglycine-generating enzyme required for sulfatase activity